MKRCIFPQGVWSPALVMVLAVSAAASATRPAETNVAAGEEWIAEEMRELRHRFADNPKALPETRQAWFEKNRKWLLLNRKLKAI